MARTFDLDSALAGANSAAGLIDKVYYAPERHKMEKEKNALAMRQGEAALDLTKLQTDTLRSEAENKKAVEVSYGSQAMQEQMLGLIQDKDKNKAMAGLTMLQGTPGYAAFSKKHGDRIPDMLDSIKKVRNSEAAYSNIVSGKATPADEDAVKQAVATMYANTTTKNIKPEDISVDVNADTGVTTVSNRGTILDRFDSPTALATLLHKDVTELEVGIDAQRVFRAAHGDKAELAYMQDRNETYKELSTLENQALTSFQKEQIALAYKASPKKRAEIITALQKDIQEVTKSKEVAGLNAMIEKQFIPIDKEVAGQKGNKAKASFIADKVDSWANAIAQSPQVQEAAGQYGLDPLALAHKYLNDKFDKYLKLAEVDTKDAHNRVLAENKKGTDTKTSSEVVKIRIDTNKELLKSYNTNAILSADDRIKVAQLQSQIDADLKILSGASYTPSGKKAEQFAPKKDRFNQDLTY